MHHNDPLSVHSVIWIGVSHLTINVVARVLDLDVAALWVGVVKCEVNQPDTVERCCFLRDVQSAFVFYGTIVRKGRVCIFYLSSETSYVSFNHGYTLLGAIKIEFRDIRSVAIQIVILSSCDQVSDGRQFTILSILFISVEVDCEINRVFFFFQHIVASFELQDVVEIVDSIGELGR